MKKYFIILFFIFSVIVFAENSAEKNENFSPQTSLIQLSAQTGIPVKKLKNMMNLKSETDNSATLQDLKIDENTVEKMIAEFSEQKHSYYGGIVVIGMLIVFVSLITIGFFIKQLQHLHLWEKWKEKHTGRQKRQFTSKKEIAAEMSSDAIVAAITAIYLHELEVEQQNRLLLTWKRTPVSMWKAISRAEKPNEQYFNKKH